MKYCKSRTCFGRIRRNHHGVSKTNIMYNNC